MYVGIVHIARQHTPGLTLWADRNGRPSDSNNTSMRIRHRHNNGVEITGNVVAAKECNYKLNIIDMACALNEPKKRVHPE